MGRSRRSRRTHLPRGGCYKENERHFGILKDHVAELCNGSTYDSDSYCLGSSPSSAAKSKTKRPADSAGFLLVLGIVQLSDNRNQPSRDGMVPGNSSSSRFPCEQSDCLMLNLHFNCFAGSAAFVFAVKRPCDRLVGLYAQLFGLEELDGV